MEEIKGLISTSVSLFYEDVDISREISSDLLSFNYIDKIGSEVDELQISLKDDQKLWAYSWSPERGAKVRAILTSSYQDLELDTGLMIIDKLSLNSPPSVFSFSAVPTPLNTPIRRKENSRNFENITLQDIASQIAKENNLDFVFDCKENPKYDRIDQKSESDLKFIDRLAREMGATVKVSNKMLVIFDMHSYENKKPIMSIDRDNGQVLSYSFQTQQSTRYKQCTIRYRDIKQKTNSKSDKSLQSIISTLANQAQNKPNQDNSTVGDKPDGYDINYDQNLKPPKKGSQSSKKEVIIYTYIDPDIEEGQEYNLKKRCRSLAEAERLCKAKLRELNLRQMTGSLSLIGNTSLQAGCVVSLYGFGSFSGAFIIEEAQHSYSASGYTTNINVRRVNNNY